MTPLASPDPCFDRSVVDKGSEPLIRDDAGAIEVLERELARSYRIERALRDVGLALGTTLERDALLRLILERTTEALDAERATLYLTEQRLLPGVGIQSRLPHIGIRGLGGLQVGGQRHLRVDHDVLAAR